MQTLHKIFIVAVAFAGMSSVALAADEILQFDIKSDGTGDHVQSQHGPIFAGKTTVTVRFDAHRLSIPANPNCLAYERNDKITGHVKSGSAGMFGDTISFVLSGSGGNDDFMTTGQFVAPRCYRGSSEINIGFTRDNADRNIDGCKDTNYGSYYVFPNICQ